MTLESRTTFLSVTRLKPRGLRFLAPIALHTWRSRQQIERAPGFLEGYLATGSGMALWTVTRWTDDAAMAAYRASAAHLKAMPSLAGSCSEAAVVHWISNDDALPTPAQAAERLLTGRTSKVRRPSPAHAAGDPWPDRLIPLRGPSLTPAADTPRTSPGKER